MNLPPGNVLLLFVCMLIQFLPSNGGHGQSLSEMLEDYRAKYPNNEPIAQPTQTRSVFSEYPYAASTDPRFNAQVSNLLATNVLQLAHDVGETLQQIRNEKTEVFSPLSIYAALSLLLLGSSGSTYQELLNIMGLSKDQYLTANSWKIHEEFGILIDDLSKNVRNEQHPRQLPNWKLYGNPRGNGPNGRYDQQQTDGDEYKISVANGIFVQHGFSIRPDYQSAVANIYKSSMTNLDFARSGAQATKYINDWVNEKTHGKIPEIVAFFQPETKVVLASALYYKAMWDTTFIEGATGPKDFFPDGLGTTPVTVQMMAHGGTFPYYDAKEYDCRILALPYRRNLATMYIILPNNSSRSRLRQLQSYLTADKIEDMISKLEWKTSIILFPKMHITNKVDLKKTFEKMGLNTLFDERRSDLSLISNGIEVTNQYQQDEARPLTVQPNYPEPNYSAAGAFAPQQVQQPLQPLSSPQDYNGIYSTQNKFNAGGYSQVRDDDDEPFIFSRHGEDDEGNSTATTEPPATTEKAVKAERRRRDVSYKVPSAAIREQEASLRFKDYIINKRITKGNADKKNVRHRRQIDQSQSLKNLDRLRTELSQGHGQNPGLFASEMLHKVDLTVNEKGTEGGAATITSLYRTGTDVVFRVDTPFLFIVRHDDTKLPLFYGTVSEPTF